jgi:hypothetical protein
MLCELLEFLMPTLVDGAQGIPFVGRHLRSCWRCNQEMQRYVDMRRQLGSLAALPVAPPRAVAWEGTPVEEVEFLRASLSLRARGARAKGALVGVGVAGAIGVLVATRLRSRLSAVG